MLYLSNITYKPLKKNSINMNKYTPEELLNNYINNREIKDIIVDLNILKNNIINSLTPFMTNDIINFCSQLPLLTNNIITYNDSYIGPTELFKCNASFSINDYVLMTKIHDIDIYDEITKCISFELKMQLIRMNKNIIIKDIIVTEVDKRIFIEILIG